MGSSEEVMNSHLVSKISKRCIVNLCNSLAVRRGFGFYFKDSESQAASFRLIQNFSCLPCTTWNIYCAPLDGFAAVWI